MIKETMQGSERKIVTVVPAFTDEQKERIAKAAEKNGFRVVFCESGKDAAKEMPGAEILVSANGSLIDLGPDLKWVCSPFAGVDPLISVLEGTDILLSNSSGAYGVTIAEHIIMVTLELMRRRMEYINLIRDRIWENTLPIHSIRDARITLLGTGNIGQETAIRLRAFSPATIVGVNRRGSDPGNLFDRIVSLSELDDILPQTDLLISSLPSTAQTRNLLTEERLRLLPTDAYLVNVGRGDILDQSALEKMLREGALGGAALDVFKVEPLPKDSTLWDCPRLVMTTHLSGTWTLPFTVERIAQMFLEDLNNYCAGRELAHRVDLKAGY